MESKMIAETQESEDQLIKTKTCKRLSAKQLAVNDDLFRFVLIIFLKNPQNIWTTEIPLHLIGKRSLGSIWWKWDETHFIFYHPLGT